MKTTALRASMVTLLAAFAFTLNSVQAQQQPQINLTYYPTNVISVTGELPMFITQDVQHSARAGISYAFTGLPALTVSYQLSDTSTNAYYTYVAAGIGLAFPEQPAVSPSFSGHVLAGVNVEITHSFSAFTEVTVAGNSFGTRMGAGIGLSYTIGGNN